MKLAIVYDKNDHKLDQQAYSNLPTYVRCVDST